MTNPSTPPVPAAWYPDPAGGPRSRWWDGTQWTEHYQEPYTPAAAGAALKAPEGTKAYNPWIWLVALLPYATLPLLFTINLGDMFSPEVLSNPERAAYAQFAIFFQPGYIAMIVLGFIITGLVIFFAFKDWKTLIAAGVPQPFHWAFIFLNLVVGPVYAIGRSVVVKRRTGHGSGVLWATIGALVATFVIVIIWMVVLTVQITQSITTYVN
jgi:hypothetical protein